jgi:hypothetical protein
MHKLVSSLMLIVAMIVVTTPACDKPPPILEQDLKISTDAASYTIIPDPVFTFKLKVESAMPAGGVKIEYSVVSEIDNQDYPQGPAMNTFNPNNTITIVLPRQKICICTIKVTSLSKSSNTATTGFRIGYK